MARGYQFSWSYSRWETYDKCPAQYKGKFIDKNPAFQTDPGPALIHGRRVHGGMAAYLTGGDNGTYYAEQEKVTYTADMRFEAKKYDLFDGVVRELASMQPVVEQNWGYKRDYSPGPWFGKDVYFRNILDVGVLWPTNHYSAVDWKTGRPKEDNALQMETQAVAIFKRYPQVHWVETRLMYVDTGQERHDEFLRKNLASLVATWDKRVGVIENDDKFAPRPGFQCQYCPLAKSKGGTCPYG